MVGFGDAIRLGFSRFVELGGRSTRAEFWWWWLTFAVITTLLEGTTLAFVAGLALFVPSITLLVRRLHDTGRSGWTAWVLLIPGVGVLILLFLLAQPGDPASNRYGPPPVHDVTRAGPSGGHGGGVRDAWRGGFHGGDPGPRGGTGAPSAPPPPDGPRHDPVRGTDERPRASGWDDLPPPAPPGAR